MIVQIYIIVIRLSIISLSFAINSILYGIIVVKFDIYV